jgi:hypothetical protein
MQEETAKRMGDGELRSYDPPRFEVIPLDCEITAYAPADGDPLL